MTVLLLVGWRTCYVKIGASAQKQLRPPLWFQCWHCFWIHGIKRLPFVSREQRKTGRIRELHRWNTHSTSVKNAIQSWTFLCSYHQTWTTVTNFQANWLNCVIKNVSIDMVAAQWPKIPKTRPKGTCCTSIISAIRTNIFFYLALGEYTRESPVQWYCGTDCIWSK